VFKVSVLTASCHKLMLYKEIIFLFW